MLKFTTTIISFFNISIIYFHISEDKKICITSAERRNKRTLFSLAKFTFLYENYNY